MNSIPLTDPIEVNNRLDELGLNKAQLLEMVDAAVAGRSNCTPFDPRSAPGWMSWRDGNRRLREILVPIGWEVDETDGIPSAVHPQRKIKLTLCNTNAGTGLKDYHPQQMSRKGAATDQIVSVNQSVFGDLLDSAARTIPISRLDRPIGVVCWYLCVYCEDEDVRAELSCPVVCEDGYFKDFHERIILVGRNDGGEGVRSRQQEPDGGDSGFEIAVSKK
jgi:hypothetical protein